MSDHPNDNNFTQIPYDSVERKRLNPNAGLSNDAKGMQVEDFTTPLPGMENGKNLTDKEDSNYRLLLRDLEERQRITGGVEASKNNKASSAAPHDYETPALRLGNQDKNKNDAGANGENFSHLPYDMVERRRLAPVLENEAPMSDEAMLKGRFETMPSRSVSETSSSRSGAKPSAPTKMAEKKVDISETDEKRKDREKIEYLKRQDENKKNDQKRIRAKELMDQIVWWNEQYGQSTYDDATIGATLYELQHELDGLPDVFKN